MSDKHTPTQGLEWALEQALEIMWTTAGAATTHGDESGALEMCNSMASGIAKNIEIAIQSTRQAEAEATRLREERDEALEGLKALIETCVLRSLRGYNHVPSMRDQQIAASKARAILASHSKEAKR